MVRWTCMPSTPILQRTVNFCPTRLNFAEQHNRKLLNCRGKIKYLFQIYIILCHFVSRHKSERGETFSHLWITADQEQVSFHGRRVSGSELQQTTFFEELAGRVNNLLLSNHLIYLQEPFHVLLQTNKTALKSIWTKLQLNVPKFHTGTVQLMQINKT